VFQSGIQVSKGHSGEETLLTKYKIVVRKMKYKIVVVVVLVTA
jgi:hypothetical protein